MPAVSVSRNRITPFLWFDGKAEVDRLWNAPIADGGAESRCGWLKDKCGLSWQIIPVALPRYLQDPDRAKADRVMQAMMKMRRIEVADLDAAAAPAA